MLSFVGSVLAPLKRRPVLTFLVGLVLLGLAGVVGMHLWSLAQFRAAEAALRAEQLGQAREYVRWCLRLWPRSPAVHLLAARIERLRGDYNQAEFHLNRVNQLRGEAREDTQLEFLFMRAQGGEADEVAPGLWRCIQEKHPQSAWILENMSRIYLRQTRFQLALRCLNHWLLLEPDTVLALDWRGWVLERLQEYDAARKDYRHALTLSPDRFTVRLRLAELLLEALRPEEAQPHLKVLAEQYSDRPDVLVALARCAFLQGDPDRAHALFDRVLDLEPKNNPALYHRGKLELQQGKPLEAEKWFRRSLEVTPGDVEARYSLAQCLRQQGNRAKEADEELSRYEKLKAASQRLQHLLNHEIEWNPRDPSIPSEAGRLLMELGMEEPALQWLGTALKRDPRHRETHRILAGYFRKIGENSKAAQHLRLAGTEQK